MDSNISAVDTTAITYTSKAAQLLNARKVSQTNRDTFLDVLQKTANVTPDKAKDALALLSDKEKEAVRAVAGLADPFYINGLSEEGAYNLLCQPGSGKDLDNNGLLSIGAGLIYTFPPPNAPDGVKKAWDEVTAGKSASDNLLLQMTFMPLEISANIKYDSNHNPVGMYFPTEPGYTNIYAQPGFSYQNLCENYIKYLENTRSYLSPENYKLRKDLVEDFSAALKKYGVN